MDKKNCERVYKTLVTLYGIDPKGDRHAMHKLFIAFHRPVTDAKGLFYKSYPSLRESEFYHLKIEYLNSLERTSEIVYETNRF
jgi:hypothetical protein